MFLNSFLSMPSLFTLRSIYLLITILIYLQDTDACASLHKKYFFWIPPSPRKKNLVKRTYILTYIIIIP